MCVFMASYKKECIEYGKVGNDWCFYDFECEFKKKKKKKLNKKGWFWLVQSWLIPFLAGKKDKLS